MVQLLQRFKTLDVTIGINGDKSIFNALSTKDGIHRIYPYIFTET